MRKCFLLALVLIPFGFVMAQDEPPTEPIPLLKQKVAAAHNEVEKLDLKLWLADSYVSGISKENHDLDTALLLLSDVEKSGAFKTDHQLQGLYHFVIARTFISNGNQDSAISRGLLGAKLLDSTTLAWAKVCFYIGVWYNARDSHLDSLRCVWLHKTIRVFDAINTKESNEWYGYTLMYLGSSPRLKPADALALNLKALDVWRVSGHQDYRQLYESISAFYTALGDQAKALHYALLAVHLDERRPIKDSISGYANYYLGYCYYMERNFREAVTYLRRFLDVTIQRNDTTNIASAAHAVVLCSTALHDYAGALSASRKANAAMPPKTPTDSIYEAEGFAFIFQSMHQLDSMRPYVNRLLALDQTLRPDDALRKRTLLMSEKYFNATGRFSQAKKYAMEVIRIAHVLGDVQLATNGYFDLSHADSALGNQRSAMAEFKQYIRLMDSLRDGQNSKQISELKVQYETEKKDNDIQVLNTKQQVDQLALRQASITRNFIIAAALLLLILLIVFINRYRLKRRTNKRLELQQAEIGKQNIALRHLVKEKDWLVKEVHHRVKNNLQIVMSLLNSQSAYIDNESALTAIHESQHRVHAMSLIHQKLYNSENLASIDMMLYVQELVSYLTDSFNTGQRIRFELNIEPLELDVSQVVPVGLILNEAITNSIKYAFPDNRKGTISIELSEDSHMRYFLCIADNGIGIPSHFASKRPGSLGMSLMAGLSADLDGTFLIENCDGTVIKISFENDIDARRSHAEIPSFVIK